jgi:hypothetical protein
LCSTPIFIWVTFRSGTADYSKALVFNPGIYLGYF